MCGEVSIKALQDSVKFPSSQLLKVEATCHSYFYFSFHCRSNRTYWEPCAIVNIRPPLKLKIRPKDKRLTTGRCIYFIYLFI